MKSLSRPSLSSQTEPCLVVWSLRGHPLLHLPDAAVYRVQTTSDSCVFLHHCADGAHKGVFIEGCFLRPWSPMSCTPASGLNRNHAQVPVLPVVLGERVADCEHQLLSWSAVFPISTSPKSFLPKHEQSQASLGTSYGWKGQWLALRTLISCLLKRPL